MAESQPSIEPTEQYHTHPAADHCPWCGQPIPEDLSEEIQTRIASRERALSAALEKSLSDRFAIEKAQAEARVREETRKEHDIIVEQIKKDAQSELAREREALEKDKTDALNTKQSEQLQERLKLKEKVDELTRQLEKKRADELGEGAEINLFEALKGAFPNDRITRIGKGEPGADIRHEVIHNGKTCGTILYDSKNRNRWMNEYVSKLHEDQLAERADHAVLSSTVFPAGKRHLYVQDGVIIVSPAHAGVVAEILRNHTVQVYKLRLSTQQREQRNDNLYEFITSNQCTQLFDRIDSLASELLDCDTKEKRAHHTTWKKRAKLLTTLQQVKGDIWSEIECIIGTAATDGELTSQTDPGAPD